MNELALVQKVWKYAHVLRDQGVPYQAYISQISTYPPPEGGRLAIDEYAIM
jgi:hypothetical protein